ncbi:MAG: prolipoprotein diacylglyceryl transferase [Candidatus Omnitrophica bacterium]|nr:prolipoprotein diacylglyceryl transferase [Candidatus Omnitrophota bacterium]MCM8828740.1 prolipoprotein diacylglyceryl transferase [Candidatus Omnitrophota bacterium]
MHPVCFKIGNFIVYWYGIFVALGVITASFLFQRRARRIGYPDSVTNIMIFYTVIFGIIGARLVHVLSYFHYYLRNPIEILMIRNGGLAIQGGIIFGILGLIFSARKTGTNVLKIVDSVALFVPLGQAIGRVGCFFHGCCYGKPSTHWFSVKFPFLEDFVHPTEIYYLIGDMVIFFFLYLFSRDKLKDGEITAWYFIFFGALRYWIDQFRGDLIPSATGFYQTQIYGIICFLIGAFWIFRIYFVRQKMI